MYKTIQENQAKIYVPEQKKISKKLPVFYNPVMKINRDISTLILNSIDKNQMQIALPLAASGVRGIRFLKELKKEKIKNISFNDYSKESIELIKKNLLLNNLKEKIKLFNKDANLFLLESKGFDYIDIDPFGTPNNFLFSSIQRLSRNGILAVTATDTSALTGTYTDASKRKYFSKSKKTELMHETGLRILIRKVQLIGAENEKALRPIFSYSKDHYYRIFVRCRKGKKRVDKILKEHGFILYCDKCLYRTVSYDIFNDMICSNCKNELDYIGPLWTGGLYSRQLVKNMEKNCKKNNKKLIDLIQTIKNESEIDTVGFYDIHEISKKYKLEKIPKIDGLIKKIEDSGKRATRTHFSPTGIKVRININELISHIRTF
ncbi:tRNA (guanine(10)-N(2))-dimethyltransferase [Candidatus Woesearchaeota archaeon]|nr:tRNA (guanine(10)-N(2))-dimethyltransferase [Candidatus Woesearchaeota archaeon]